MPKLPRVSLHVMRESVSSAEARCAASGSATHTRRRRRLGRGGQRCTLALAVVLLHVDRAPLAGGSSSRPAWTDAPMEIPIPQDIAQKVQEMRTKPYRRKEKALEKLLKKKHHGVIDATKLTAQWGTGRRGASRRRRWQWWRLRKNG